MNIHGLYPVIWKELKEMRYRGKIILGLVIFAVAFLAFILITQSRQTMSTTFLNIQNFAVSIVFYAQLFTMFAIGMTIIVYAFNYERLEKTLEPLLCTPLNITTIWLGKVIVISLISYLWSIIVTISIIIIFHLFLSLTISLSAPILVQIFIVSPLLATASVGLVGFTFLVFKNIQVTKFINVFIIVGMSLLVTNFLREGIIKSLIISWRLVALFFLISISLITVIAFCTRFLRKERVI